MTTPRRWQSVEGWLSQEEGDALQDLALRRRVLELGAYCGRSTLCLAEVAHLVVSVDWHLGCDGIGHWDTLPVYMRSVRGAEHVIPIIARFDDAEPILQSYSFDVVFIDGAHDRRSVVVDTAMAARLLRSGGVIAWHDYGCRDWPGVQEAVDWMFPEPHIHGLAGTLAWRKIDAPGTAAPAPLAK